MPRRVELGHAKVPLENIRQSSLRKWAEISFMRESEPDWLHRGYRGPRLRGTLLRVKVKHRVEIREQCTNHSRLQVIIEFFAPFAVEVDGDALIKNEKIFPGEFANLARAPTGRKQKQEEGIVPFASQGLSVDFGKGFGNLLFKEGVSRDIILDFPPLNLSQMSRNPESTHLAEC